MKRYLILAAFSAVALSSTTARATVVYKNLNNGSNGNYAVEDINDNNTDYANEFLTPVGSTLSLTDIIATIEQGIGTGTVSAYLYSNTSAGNAPNANIATVATLTQSSIPVSPAPVTFTAPTGSGAILLQPSTEYWLVLSGSDNFVTDARWEYGTGETGVGTTGVAGQNFAFFNGAAWDTEPNDSNSSGIPEFEVDATAVPEPASAGWVTLGLAGFIFTRRHRPGSSVA